MSDIIVNACMEFENYPIKTVGEDVFYRYYILYYYFKKIKKSPNIFKWFDRRKKHKPGRLYNI